MFCDYIIWGCFWALGKRFFSAGGNSRKSSGDNAANFAKKVENLLISLSLFVVNKRGFRGTRTNSLRSISYVFRSGLDFREYRVCYTSRHCLLFVVRAHIKNRLPTSKKKRNTCFQKMLFVPLHTSSVFLIKAQCRRLRGIEGHFFFLLDDVSTRCAFIAPSSYFDYHVSPCTALLPPRPGPGPALSGLRRGLQQEVPLPAQPEEAPGAVAGAARQVGTNAFFCV